MGLTINHTRVIIKKDCITTKIHAGNASANNTPKVNDATRQVITIHEKIKGTPPHYHYMNGVHFVLLLCANDKQKSVPDGDFGSIVIKFIAYSKA